MTDYESNINKKVGRIFEKTKFETEQIHGIMNVLRKREIRDHF